MIRAGFSLLCALAAGSAGCAFMYFDQTRVIVYPRELTGRGLEMSTYVTNSWGENLVVTHDPRDHDLREKRYGINIGKNVFDGFGRNVERAVHETTEKIVREHKLCAKGWTKVSKGPATYYSGGIGWTILCNELGS